MSCRLIAFQKEKEEFFSEENKEDIVYTEFDENGNVEVKVLNMEEEWAKN